MNDNETRWNRNTLDRCMVTVRPLDGGCICCIAGGGLKRASLGRRGSVTNKKNPQYQMLCSIEHLLRIILPLCLKSAAVAFANDGPSNLDLESMGAILPRKSFETGGGIFDSSLGFGLRDLSLFIWASGRICCSCHLKYSSVKEWALLFPDRLRKTSKEG